MSLFYSMLVLNHQPITMTPLRHHDDTQLYQQYVFQHGTDVIGVVEQMTCPVFEALLAMLEKSLVTTELHAGWQCRQRYTWEQNHDTLSNTTVINSDGGVTVELSKLVRPKQQCPAPVIDIVDNRSNTLLGRFTLTLPVKEQVQGATSEMQLVKPTCVELEERRVFSNQKWRFTVSKQYIGTSRSSIEFQKQYLQPLYLLTVEQLDAHDNPLTLYRQVCHMFNELGYQ